MQSIGRIQYSVSRGHGMGTWDGEGEGPGCSGHSSDNGIGLYYRKAPFRSQRRTGVNTSKSALLVGWNVEIRY